MFQYEEAIDLCAEHRVSLTDKLADTLSPPPGYPRRNQLLEKLADYALTQANYYLATKKYTQAGKKVSPLQDFSIDVKVKKVA